MKFRTDINGLRALAVMAVVLFHFNPSWVPGGFAGVDVFFVISGFLMTGLIFRGLENNNFSIINFYVARANRIIPALSVVCLALLVFGWFYLTPLDYRELGKHVASSMGFLSNVIYWQESGYFDTASHSKWLLHTWSLSVEWQFYMIYPVVLVLLKKCISLTNIKRLLVVGTVVGFIFSVYATYRWPNPAYFLFPTRAWEMMMGGLAFLYPLQNLKETSKKYLEWVGIALILASYAFISKDNLWPGYLALIPVLGTYLVILANRSSSVITDNIVMQKVGLWSYSIYLWHWPVVVFGYYFEMQYWEWIGISVSVVLGFCSYKFVESIKFPTLSSISFKPIATLKPLWMVMSIGLISCFIFIGNGIEVRLDNNLKNFKINDKAYKSLPVEILKIRNDECRLYYKDNIEYYDGCNKLDKYQKNIKAIIIGDSHAGAMSPGVLSSLRKFSKSDGIISARASGCIPLLNIHHRKGAIFKGCGKYNEYLYSKLLSSYKKTPIIIISRLNLYPFGFNESGEIDKPFVFFDDDNEVYNQEVYLNKFKSNIIDNFCQLTKNGRKVYLVRPTPEFLNNPKLSNDYLKQEYIHNNVHSIFLSENEYNKRNNYINNVIVELQSKCNIKILNPLPLLYKDNSYISDVNSVAIYEDASHLNIKGALYLSDIFDRVWKDQKLSITEL